jgi:hypothetical protein
MLHFGDFALPKRPGLVAHGALVLLCSIISLVGFVHLATAELGPRFLMDLVAGLLGLLPIPVLGYRAYALSRARYVLSRGSLAIEWGLRVEDIPLDDIEWMRLAEDLSRPLQLPKLALPGAIVGFRQHPDLGRVEFLASDAGRLLLVATSRLVFVISPENPAALMQAFARATEMGTLLPSEGKSVRPSFIIADAWGRAPVRFLWLTGTVLNLGMFVWVSLLVPTIGRIALRPRVGLVLPDSVPSAQLVLVPVSSLILLAAGWLAGLYFYRWKRERPLAFIVWTSSTIGSLLFLVAIFFIVTTPV